METIDVINVKPINASIVEAEDKQVVVLVSEANAFPALCNQADFLLVGELRSKLKGKIKRLEELRKSATGPLDTAKSIIMGWFKPVTAKAEQGIEYLDELTINYTQEQERIAREAQAKLDEAARKEREKAEAKARELEAKGKTEQAQAMQAKADAVIAPLVAPTTPKVAGQGIREIWDFEIVESSLIPRQYLIPDDAMIRKIANATKGKFNMAGVKFYSKKIVSGRSI